MHGAAGSDGDPGNRARPDAGSTSLEVVMVVPVLMLLALFVLWAGRGGRAALIADLAAEEAATAAAIACEQDEDPACEELVAEVLSTRPGLNFLCIGGPRPAGGDGLVDQRFVRFRPDDPNSAPDYEAAGVGVFGVRFECETDGAVAPLRGAFPTVTFLGQATEVAIQQGPPRAKISDDTATEGAPDGGDVLMFVVRLDTPSPVEVVLNYTITNQTGYTSGGDCTAPPVPDYELPPSPLTVTIDEGAVEATIAIETCDDSLDELDERIQIELGEPPRINPLDDESPFIIVLEDNTAEGTIIDDDGPPTVRVSEPGVREGAGDPLEFDITVDREIGRDINFTYNTATGTGNDPANPGASCPARDANVGDPVDYVAIDTAVTHVFQPGSLTHTVSVAVCDDLVGEPDETLELVWTTSPDSGSGTAVGTIEDDEPRLIVQDVCLRDQKADACVDEPDSSPGTSDSSLEFVVERVDHQFQNYPDTGGTPPQVQAVYVTVPIDPQLGADHEAHAGGTGAIVNPCSDPPAALTVRPSSQYHDYVPQTGTVTIPSGDQSATVTVPIYNDALDEHNESFRLQLCNPSDSAFIDQPWGHALIFDDDTPPDLEVSDASAPEPDNLNPTDTQLEFTVELSAPSGRDVNVDYYTDRADYYTDPLTPAPVDIQDLTAEPDPPDADYTAVPVSDGRVTIAAQVDIPPPGQGPPQQTIRVAVLHDTLDEGRDDETGAETLALRLAATHAGFADSTDPGPCTPGVVDNNCALGLIIDNDQPPAVSVFAPGVAVAEGGDAVFELRLVDPNTPADKDSLRPSGQEVTVGYRVVARDTAVLPDPGHLTATGADLRGVEIVGVYEFEGTATFDAGDTVVPVSVTTADDDLDEIDREDFELRLVPNSATNADIGEDTATAQIQDNDAPPELDVLDRCVDGAGWAQTVWQAGDACAVENGGSVRFYVGLVDSNDTPVTSGRNVTVAYKTIQLADADDSAIGGAASDIPPPDYIAVDAGTVTVIEGRSDAYFDVQIVDDVADPIDELNERFQVEVYYDSNNPDVVTIDDELGQGVIVDDDTAALSFTDDCATDIDGADVQACGDEGAATMTFTLELSQEVSRKVTVQYYTVDLSATAGDDYDGWPSSPESDRGTLTIDENTTTATIPVTIRDDEIYEHDETFQLVLDNIANASLSDPRAVGAILDDEDAPRISVADATAEEGDGAAVQFAVRLLDAGGDPAPIGREVTVSYSTADITADIAATAAEDYQPASGVLTFTPDPVDPTANTTKTVTVTIIDDDLAEDPETFELRLTGQDPPDVQLNAGTSPCAAQTEPGGTVDDDCAVGTITDDGDTPPQVVVDPATAEEGQPLVFTVRLVDPTDPALTRPWPSGQEVTVTYETTQGTGTAEPRPAGQQCDVTEPTFDSAYTYDYDYVAATGTVTFDPDDPDPAARTQQSIRVVTCDDWHHEPDNETLQLTLTAPQDANATVEAGSDTAEGTITDDEKLPVATIAGNATAVEEGDPAVFTVQLLNADHPTRPAPSVNQITVPYHTYSTGTGTLNATPGNAGTPPDPPDPPEADYQQVPADGATTVQFAPRGTQQQVSIATFTDARAETSEAFQLVLDAPLDDSAGNAVADLDARRGVGTITDACITSTQRDNMAVPLELKLDDFSVNESRPDGRGEYTFTVTIEGAFCDPAPFQVRALLGPGDTAASADGQLGGGTPSRFQYPAEASEIHITITEGLNNATPNSITNDSIDEHDETFTLELRWVSPMPAEFTALDATTTVTVTILDDDDPPVAVIFGPDPNEAQQDVDEGDPAEFTVRLVDRHDPAYPLSEAVASGKEVTVPYMTCCGTATPSVDYDAVDPAVDLVFGAGSVTEHPISIDIHDDGVVEPVDEYFLVQLGTPTDANLDANRNRSARVNITECLDPAQHQSGGPVPAIVHNVTGNETEPENTTRHLPYTFGFEPMLCPGASLELAYSTRDGTATAGQDYLAANGTLTGTIDSDGYSLVSGGVPTVTVQAINDHVDEELYEQFYLDVKWGDAMPDEWEVPTTQFTGQIIDDDDLVVSAGVTRAMGFAEGSPVVFEVTSTPSERTVVAGYQTRQLLTGNYAVQGMSCVGDFDYIGDSGSVTFAPVSDPNSYDPWDLVRQQVEVVTCSDGRAEDDERLQLRLDLEEPDNLEPTEGVAQQLASGTILDCIDSTVPPSTLDPPTLTVRDVVVREGDTVTVPVTLSPKPFCVRTGFVFNMVETGSADYWTDIRGSNSGGFRWSDRSSQDPLESTFFEYEAVVDGEVEGPETIELHVHFCYRPAFPDGCNLADVDQWHPDYANLPTAVGTITIEDADCVDAADPDYSGPAVTVEPVADEPVVEHDGTVMLPWELSLPLCGPSRAQFRTSSRTAHGSSDGTLDYAQLARTDVEVDAYVDSGAIELQIHDDDLIEGVEYFRAEARLIEGVPSGWQAWSGDFVYILDDECISITSSVDDRVPAITFEPIDQPFYEGQSGIVELSLDTPLCQYSEVLHDLDHITTTAEDFLQENSYTQGGTWNRSLSANTQSQRSVTDIRADSDVEGEEQYRVATVWDPDWCTADAPRFCDQPPVETVFTISDSCVSDTDRLDDLIDAQPLRVFQGPDETTELEVAEGELLSFSVGVSQPFCSPADYVITETYDTASANDVEPWLRGPQQLEQGALTDELLTGEPWAVSDGIDEWDEQLSLQIAWAPAMPRHYRDLAPVEVTVTIIDDDPEPVLDVGDAQAVDDPAATPAARTLNFTVSLSEQSGREVRVRYETFALTATGGTSCGTSVDGASVDYITTSGELVFTAGDTSEPVSVTVCGDSDDDEPYETLQLRLVSDPDHPTMPSPVNAQLGDHTGVGTIAGLPTITVRDVTGRSEGASPVAYVVLGVGLTEAVTVTVATEDCTAGDFGCAHPAADPDYQSRSLQVTLTPANPSRTIETSIRDDTLDEHDEAFYVRLSNPSVAVLLAGWTHNSEPVGIVRIVDDDPLPVIGLQDTGVSVEEGQSFTFNVTLSTASGRDVSVSWATEDCPATDCANRATAGDADTGDYIAANGTATITAGQTTGSFTVSTRADAENVELEETFIVRLSSAVHATLGVDEARGTIAGDCADLDDPPPAIFVEEKQVTEGDRSNVTARVEPPLCDTPSNVNLDWITVGITAETGDVGLNFAPVWGNQGVTITDQHIFPLQTNHDADTDDETFRLQVRWRWPSDWAGQSEASATITIIDDD